MRKIYVCLLAVMFLSACNSSLPGSSSTSIESSSEISSSEDVDLGITTQEELAAIADDLSGTFELGANIILEDDWTPIGSQYSPFTGTLEGNGFAITGLTIDTSDLIFDIEETIESEVTTYEANDYLGLFGVNAGTINNVVLEEVDISGTLAEYTGAMVIEESKIYIGALVGKNFGTLTTIKTTGTIEVISPSSGLKVGGVIGMSEDGIINNVYSSVEVTATSENKVVAGGILGEVEGSETDLDLLKATGNITAIMNGDSAIEEQAYAGGVLGLMQGGTLNDAFASGTVTSSISGAKPAYAGGLIGAYDASDFDMAVQDVYASGEVSATSTTETKVYAGGVLGRYEDKEAGHVVSLTNALASNDVSGATLSGTKVYVGTLIGLCDTTGATITNSYYTGTATMVSGKSNGTGTYGTATDLNTITTATMGWNINIWTIETGVVDLSSAVE